MSDEANDGGQPLERFQPYLDLLLRGRFRLDRRLQGKLDASDLIQATLLEAYRSRDRFVGDDVAVHHLHRAREDGDLEGSQGLGQRGVAEDVLDPVAVQGNGVSAVAQRRPGAAPAGRTCRWRCTACRCRWESRCRF
jgi:hypothetical protein